MTGGNPAPGGGAAWIDLTTCRTAAGERTVSDADLAAAMEAPSSCTGYQIATHYALAEDGKGVYVLAPTQEQHDDMNRRPAAMSRGEELEIFKYYNATYYEDLSLLPGGEELVGFLVPDDY